MRTINKKNKNYFRAIWVSLWVATLIFFNFQIAKASNKVNASQLKVEKFFKTLKSMKADFIQIGPSGNVSNGKIYLDLPGKLRIDYEKPNDVLIFFGILKFGSR